MLRLGFGTGSRSGKAVLLAVSVVVTAVVCAGGLAATPNRAANQSLVIQQGLAPILDPAFFNNSNNYTLVNNLFETLVKKGQRGRLTPGLALSWSSRDNKTWTFNLRTNARFSDGSRITAAGVRASLVRTFMPITNAQMQALGVTNTFPQGFTVIPELLGASAVQNGRAQAIPARAITAPNARTIRIVLEEPRSDLPERLTFPAFGIVKVANVQGASGSTPWWYRPVSSGPFAVSSFVPNTSVTIVPNRRYYGTKAVLQKVEFKVVTNTQTAEIAYQSGDLDFVKTVYSDVLNLQSKGLQSQMRAYTDLNVSNFIVNGQVEPTDDPAVARALAMAIDRTTLTKTVLDGLVQPSTTFTPPGLAPGYSAKGFRNGYRFNPTAARAELAKSKYGSNITIRAWASSSQDPRAIQAIAQMWQQNLGIRVSIQTSLNPAQAPKSQAANVIFSAQGATFAAPCAMMQRWPDFIVFAGGANNVNFGAVQNPRLKAAMDACYAASPKDVWSKVMAAENVMAETPQFIPVHYNRSFYLVKPKIRGLALGPYWNIANLSSVWVAAT
jgi:oligopeptide transport system substrate-binding protein